MKLTLKSTGTVPLEEYIKRCEEDGSQVARFDVSTYTNRQSEVTIKLGPYGELWISLWIDGDSYYLRNLPTREDDWNEVMSEIG